MTLAHIKSLSTKKNEVRQHIESFATVESHYCRKDTNKKYLPPTLSVQKMYDEYLKTCAGVPVKLSYYRHIFNTEFNLAFHHPIKDQCDLCASYHNSNENQKQTMQSTYDSHLANKNAAQENKITDKEKAQEKNTDFIAACFDLEEVLLTPHSFESALYYKRRLNTYNFTLYDFGSTDGHCFVWNESIASRGVCEIASCVYTFIKTKSESGKKSFVFFSDNCSAQNKNKFYVAMLWYAIQKFSLTCI